MKIDFKDRVVLITGATRGIGKQLADDFSRSGARLILTGTHSEQIARLNRSYGNKRAYYCVDFTDPESMESFMQEIRKYKKIDVCVNNAGINRIDFIDEARLKDWDEVMAVNLRAPFAITSEVSKAMKENRYGRIVNISSIFGVISREKRSIYSSSKFGILGLTTAASNELAQYNVLVNAVSPGFVLTDLTRRILSEKERKAIEREIPEKRFASPADISSVVLFLASSLNTYLTGQNIVVDGGYTNV